MTVSNKLRFAFPIAALFLSLMAVQPTARAAYTDFDAAIDYYFHDWTYSAISPDRHWLVYSSNAQLIVVDTSGASPDRKFILPKAINGLAIANDGRKLVAILNGGMPMLADLGRAASGASSTELQWTPLIHTGSTQGNPSAGEDIPPRVPPKPIALSGDGRYFATIGGDCNSGTGFIRVSDVNTLAPLRAFPTSVEDETRRIEFADGSNKLAVLGAKTHALWDLRSGALINEASFNTMSDESYAFESTFDHSTDLAYVQGPQGDIARLDLGDCSKPVTSTKLKTGSILAIDASGNWYAQADGAKIDVFQITDNKHLATFKAPFDIAFLAPGSVPTTLIAVSRTKGPVDLGGRSEAPIPDIARHIVFHLPKDSVLVSPTPAKRGSQQCLFPEESPGARNIKHEAPPPVRKTELAFHNCSGNYCGILITENGKPFDGCSFDLFYPAWGKNRQDEIWVDHCNEVVRIDPHSGAELEKLPTPRNGKFISITWFARGGFLNWQGDTVTFRSFRGERRVLASKPGWHVNLAFIEGSNTFGVLWVKNNFMGANKDPNQRLGPMGSGLAVRYDFDTLRVLMQMEAAARVPEETELPDTSQLVFDPSTFEAETEGSGPTELEQRAEIFTSYNFHRAPQQATPEYRWEIAMFNSVRLLSTPASGEPQVLLWDGLAAYANTGTASPRTIFDFGTAKAAVVRADNSIDFYDGKERRILAHLPAQNRRIAEKAEWLATESLLAADSCESNAGKDCSLRFYTLGEAK